MQPICDDFFHGLDAPSGPSSMHLNEPVRAYLTAAREYLLDLHDRGVPASRVNAEHAEVMDRLIRKLFRLAEDRYFSAFPRLNFRLAVIAVGGYGRSELSLGSDIDLLFLHHGKVNPYVETIAEALTHRLWDAKLVVGAATRTIRECLKLGAQDLSTLTSYLDARFLIGNTELFAEFETAVHDHVRRDRGKFVQGKLEERHARHEAFHESLYLLQPNLRESVGGLRDYHTALWLARAVQWDVKKPEHLHLHGLIDAPDSARLDRALEFMWRARNELHRTGRKDDQVHYGAQERLVKVMAFPEDEALLPVENLMRAYYTHARSIDYVCKQVIGHAEAHVKRRKRFGGGTAAYAVEEGFAVSEGRLEIPSAQVLIDRPVRMLAAFAVAQHHDVELSARAQRLVHGHLRLIDEALLDDAEASAIFMRILASPMRVYRSLQLMDELGVLGAFLPEFGHLVGLWQQDMYHTYTVDIHSLFLVEQLRRLKKGRFADELPLATELVREVRTPAVLYLACILHDIGKGHGGGHSQKGADMAPAVCKRLGLSDEETEHVQFLVRHHLTMSAMAEQRDVDDPRQIMRLVQLAPTREALRNLYLLTVADIRSVSPTAWTPWKAGLLQRFYRNAAEWLEAELEDAQAEQFFLVRALRRFARAEREVLKQVEARGASTEAASGFLDRMPRRYLLSHEIKDVVEHVLAGLDYEQADRPVGVYAFVDATEDQPFWGIVVLARDRPGLFSTVSGVLASCHHDILAAHVYTTRDGLALETYLVPPIAGGVEEAEVERQRIEARLAEVLAGSRALGPVLQARRKLPSVSAMRLQPPSVRVLNSESDLYTVVEVVTNDRPALLYDITGTLAELGVEVVVCRAGTRANRATDSFYVTEQGRKILDPERVKRIEEGLQRAIRQEEG